MDQSSTKIVAEADILFEQGKAEDANQMLSQHKDEKDPQILWRLARIYRELGRNPSLSEEEKKPYKLQGLEFARQGLAEGQDIARCHQWYGIMLEERCGLTGIREALKDLQDRKDAYQKAIELAPQDPYSYYLLGDWCYSIIDAPWYQRKVVELFSQTSPKTSYEEALKNFQKAEELAPDFSCVNHLMIGKCLLAMKKNDKGKAWLEKASQFDAKIDEDKKAVKEAKELLKK